MIRSLLNMLVIIVKTLFRDFILSLISFLGSFGAPAGRFQAWLLNSVGAKTKGTIRFGKRILILDAHRLVLGERVAIGDNAHIACHSQIIIGDDFLAAPGLYLNSGRHDVLTLQGYGEPIRIGDRVWCGSRVTICSGVQIGDDVVIGAGSVVTKPIPSGCFAAGAPARVIRTIERDTKYFERTLVK